MRCSKKEADASFLRERKRRVPLNLKNTRLKIRYFYKSGGCGIRLSMLVHLETFATSSVAAARGSRPICFKFLSKILDKNFESGGCGTRTHEPSKGFRFSKPVQWPLCESSDFYFIIKFLKIKFFTSCFRGRTILSHKKVVHRRPLAGDRVRCIII